MAKSRTVAKSRQQNYDKITCNKYGSSKKVNKVHQKIADIISELKVRIDSKQVTRSRSAENSMIMLEPKETNNDKKSNKQIDMIEETKIPYSNKIKNLKSKDIQNKNVRKSSDDFPSLKDLKSKLSKLEYCFESSLSPSKRSSKDKKTETKDNRGNKLLKIKRKYGYNCMNLPVININIMADKIDPIFKISCSNVSGLKRLKKTKSLSECLIKTKHNNASLDHLLEFNEKN